MRPTTFLCVSNRLPFRPLPGALAPLLQTQLDLVLEKLCTAFPPARACLEAAADGSGSVQLQKMAAFRGRIEGLAAIRDEHDADLTAELAEGMVMAIQPWQHGARVRHCCLDIMAVAHLADGRI